MNAKHTPGPWIASRIVPFDSAFARRVRAGNDPIADCYWLEGDGNECAANAALIAAAPDMMAALDMVRAWVDMGGLEGPYANPDAMPIAEVRAAIAKATGATP